MTANFTDFIADGSPAKRVGELFLVTVTDGHVEIGVSSCTPMLGWGAQDEMNMPADEQNVTVSLEPVAQSGSGYNSHRSHAGGKINFGKVWRGIKKFVSGVAKVGNSVGNAVSSVASFIPHPAAQALSQGISIGNSALQRVNNTLNPVQQQLALQPAVQAAVQDAVADAVQGSGMRFRRKGRGLLLG